MLIEFLTAALVLAALAGFWAALQVLVQRRPDATSGNVLSCGSCGLNNLEHCSGCSLNGEGLRLGTDIQAYLPQISRRSLFLDDLSQEILH